MACCGDVQVVPPGVEVQLPAVEACDGGSGSEMTTTEESVKELQEKPVVQDSHGGGGSATTTTEYNVKLLQEQPAAEAHDGETATEESVSMLPQEQHDTTLEPDHHEAAELSESEEPNEEKPPVAKEQGEQNKAPAGGDDQESTRERLKRHRQEMAGRVWVPEMWGQEKLLKDWVNSAVFDQPLVPAGLLTARRALVAESYTRRPDRTSTVTSAGSSPLRVRNGCST